MLAVVRRHRLFLVVLSVVLAGCVAAPILPSAQQIQAVRTVDVVIQVPPSNFAYFQGGTTVYAQPSVGMSLGTGIGINIVANLVFAGIESLATATAREAREPVGRSVASLDLRSTVMTNLRDPQGQASRLLSLTLSDREFPKVEIEPPAPPTSERSSSSTRISFLEAVSKPVANSDADAILYVSVAPFFRSASGRMEVHGSSWLIGKDGTPLFTTSVMFIGPDHPDLDRTPLVQWWADERYRRYLLQGVRAVMLPAAENLHRPPDDARRSELQKRIGSRQNSSMNSDRMRSTLCPFQADDAPVVYRYEQYSRHMRVVALCADEKIVLPDPDLIPDIAWVTARQPALPPPIGK